MGERDEEVLKWASSRQSAVAKCEDGARRQTGLRQVTPSPAKVPSVSGVEGDVGG